MHAAWRTTLNSCWKVKEIQQFFSEYFPAWTKTKISSSIWQNQPTSWCSSRKHSLSAGTSIKIHTLTGGVSVCKYALIRTEMKDCQTLQLMSNRRKSYQSHLHAHIIFIPTYYTMFLLIIILLYF